MTFLDDAALIEQVRGGVEEAFSALWTRYYASAYNYARIQAGGRPDDADDIVTDAYARVWQTIQRGRGPSRNFRAYLYATIRTVAIDRGLLLEEPVEDIEGQLPACDDAATMLEPTPELDAVARCFYALNERYRQVLWLSAVDGLKPAEIAKRLGLDARHVSVLTMRARTAFRKLYIQTVGEMK